MTMPSSDSNESQESWWPTTRLSKGLAIVLALLASPTFALMAWITTSDASPMTLCSAGSSFLPIGGMTAMYLLMSLFHLSPWLKLANGQPLIHS